MDNRLNLPTVGDLIAMLQEVDPNLPAVIKHREIGVNSVTGISETIIEPFQNCERWWQGEHNEIAGTPAPAHAKTFPAIRIDGTHLGPQL